MPIKVQRDLPAKAILESENIFITTTSVPIRATIALSARIYATARRWKNFSRKYSRML